jgi:hypothetical protein
MSTTTRVGLASSITPVNASSLVIKIKEATGGQFSAGTGWSGLIKYAKCLPALTRRDPGLRQVDHVWFLPLWGSEKFVGTDDQEVSVRAFLRSLPSVAFWVLFICISFWALLAWTNTPHRPSFWQTLLAWPVVTLWLGPTWWLYYHRRSDAPGLWSGIAVAMLWLLCVCPALLGLAYAAAAGLFGFGR